MKKVFLIIAVAAASSFLSCTKEPCETANTGTLKVINSNSDDTYYVNVDGAAVGEVAGRGSTSFSVKAGARSVNVVQKTGVVISPSEHTNTVNVSKCKTSEYSY